MIFLTKNNQGKLFYELNNNDKKKISKAISRRFKLSLKDSRQMLDDASREGYLKYGGKINLR